MSVRLCYGSFLQRFEGLNDLGKKQTIGYFYVLQRRIHFPIKLWKSLERFHDTKTFYRKKIVIVMLTRKAAFNVQSTML